MLHYLPYSVIDMPTETMDPYNYVANISSQVKNGILLYLYVDLTNFILLATFKTSSWRSKLLMKVHA